MRATHRIQSFRYTQPNDWHRQAAHAVVSPPEGEINNERQYWEGRKRAAEIAEEKGWRGFAVVPHPYRPTEEGKERYRVEVPRDEDGDPEYGFWVWVRNDVDDWRGLVEWSPHYHIIGATGAGMDPAREGDAWSYTFIRSVESFGGTRDRESHEDLYGLFRYLLSHTGFPEGSTNQVTTWYGDLANSIFVEDATEEWQIPKPSEALRSVLKDEIEAVAGSVTSDGSDGSGGDESHEREECPVDGCDGEMIDVWDVTAFLRFADPPPDVAKRMRAARDWRLGRIEPPPGLKRPQTEEDAQEAFGRLLRGGS